MSSGQHELNFFLSRYYVSVELILSSIFVYVRSVFDVIKTDINNIDEENGYCVMMVLANSKNVIKIFSSSSASSSHSIILLFFAVVLTKISRKTTKKKKERIDSAVYVVEKTKERQRKKRKNKK
jgi:hypothetical protein